MLQQKQAASIAYPNNDGFQPDASFLMSSLYMITVDVVPPPRHAVAHRGYNSIPVSTFFSRVLTIQSHSHSITAPY